MQISRHWRMNAQRYRLEGTRTANGDVQFQPHLPVTQENVVERMVEAVPTTMTQQHPAAPAIVRAARTAAR